MTEHEIIYREEAERYDLMIAREDYEGNVAKILRELLPDPGKLDVMDMGAGTGKLSQLLAPRVRSLIAADASQAMLDVAARKLEELGCTNWRTLVADHLRLPLPDNSVDVVTAGWTICYLTNTNEPEWRGNLQTIMGEIKRVLRPNGTIIFFENNGTGSGTPNPPSFLTGYFQALEEEYEFRQTSIRTDFRFESIDEAEALTRLFFGDWLADSIMLDKLTLVPGCTTVLWKSLTDEDPVNISI